MAHYLDPKNDIPFKKVFENKALLISFLNALLPIEQAIEDVEYLSPESIPDTPIGKFSSVDVRCKDLAGRYFIVEMQLFWSWLFAKRIVFNASRALVKQMDRTSRTAPPKTFDALRPVYTLAIVNARFSHKDGDRWYYHYKIADIDKPERVLEGLEFVIVDLENFKRTGSAVLGKWTMEKKRMAVAWLHFLQDVEAYAQSAEAKEHDEIKAAISLCEHGAYTQDELDAYETQELRLIDEVSVAALEDALAEKKIALAEKDNALAEKDNALAEKDSVIAEKDSVIAEKDKELAALTRRLAELENRK